MKYKHFLDPDLWHTQDQLTYTLATIKNRGLENTCIHLILKNNIQLKKIFPAWISLINAVLANISFPRQAWFCNDFQFCSLKRPLNHFPIWKLQFYRNIDILQWFSILFFKKTLNGFRLWKLHFYRNIYDIINYGVLTAKSKKYIFWKEVDY